MKVDYRVCPFLGEIAFGLCLQWKILNLALNAGHSALEKLIYPEPWHSHLAQRRSILIYLVFC